MDTPIERCCVRESARLVDAMRAIDAGGAGIALVLDGEERLVGTLTDGDIRRALLAGADLEAPLVPHVQRSFASVGMEAGRAEVLDLMQARLLNQVPIVDAIGRLRGLHLLHEVIGAEERPNWAVVMAGGLGTRLHPITELVPKALLRVAGRPILERLVLHLVGFGLRRIFLAINYKGELIEEHFGDGSRFGCRIEYLREDEALGTGGPLALLPESPRDPLVVLNGDLVTQVSIARMLAFHAAGAYTATIGVRRYVHEVPFGCLDLDGARVVRLEEKPILERPINAGVYALSPDVVARVPARFFPITDLFDDCLRRGERVGAFPIEDDWIDVGRHEQLRQAREGVGPA